MSNMNLPKEEETKEVPENNEMITPDGKVEILTPDEIAKQRAEANNIQAERTGRAEAIRENELGGGLENEKKELKIKKEKICLTQGGEFKGTEKGYRIVDLFVREYPGGGFVAFYDQKSAESGIGGVKTGMVKMGEGGKRAIAEKDYDSFMNIPTGEATITGQKNGEGKGFRAGIKSFMGKIGL